LANDRTWIPCWRNGGKEYWVSENTLSKNRLYVQLYPKSIRVKKTKIETKAKGDGDVTGEGRQKKRQPHNAHHKTSK